MESRLKLETEKVKNTKIQFIDIIKFEDATEENIVSASLVELSSWAEQGERYIKERNDSESFNTDDFIDEFANGEINPEAISNVFNPIIAPRLHSRLHNVFEDNMQSAKNKLAAIKARITLEQAKLSKENEVEEKVLSSNSTPAKKERATKKSVKKKHHNKNKKKYKNSFIDPDEALHNKIMQETKLIEGEETLSKVNTAPLQQHRDILKRINEVPENQSEFQEQAALDRIAKVTIEKFSISDMNLILKLKSQFFDEYTNKFAGKDSAKVGVSYFNKEEVKRGFFLYNTINDLYKKYCDLNEVYMQSYIKPKANQPVEPKAFTVNTIQQQLNMIFRYVTGKANKQVTVGLESEGNAQYIILTFSNIFKKKDNLTSINKMDVDTIKMSSTIHGYILLFLKSWSTHADSIVTRINAYMEKKITASLSMTQNKKAIKNFQQKNTSHRSATTLATVTFQSNDIPVRIGTELISMISLTALHVEKLLKKEAPCNLTIEISATRSSKLHDIHVKHCQDSHTFSIKLIWIISYLLGDHLPKNINKLFQIFRHPILSNMMVNIPDLHTTLPKKIDYEYIKNIATIVYIDINNIKRDSIASLPAKVALSFMRKLDVKYCIALFTDDKQETLGGYTTHGFFIDKHKQELIEKIYNKVIALDTQASSHYYATDEKSFSFEKFDKYLDSLLSSLSSETNQAEHWRVRCKQMLFSSQPSEIRIAKYRLDLVNDDSDNCYRPI